MKCLICDCEIENSVAFSNHLKKIHKTTSKQYYDKYLKKKNEGLCPICGKETPFLGFKKRYQPHCSCLCAQRNPKVNNFIVNNPQKNPEIREKTKQTCIIKYGGAILSNPDIREKGKQTLKEKFGVENIFQLPEIQQKARDNSHTATSNKKRENTKLENIRNIAKENNCIYIQDLLNMTKSSGWYQCDVVKIIKLGNSLFVRNEDIQKVIDYDNNSYHVYSISEKRIVNEIEKIYKGKIIENSKSIIYPKELDIYLPKLNLAVEYNGVYFHSSLANTPIDYHLDKSIRCRNKNIRLIHIYEFEDLTDQIELLKSLILGKDNYPIDDFNKNNLLATIPEPELIFDDGRLQVYGAGFLK